MSCSVGSSRFAANAAFDLLISNATIFDGSGGPPVVGDIAVRDGEISARGKDLDKSLADRVIDASGMWLTPGLLDIHTHYDLEVELASAEIAEMERLLEKGMREGYVGFSPDGLPFHYLSNDPNRDRRIPSQYGGYRELKRLTDIVRRVWQAPPPTDNPLRVFKTFC